MNPAPPASGSRDAGTTRASREVDVVVIGGGQAGLATGFYLRRAGLVPGTDFVILDAAEHPGGAWPRMWEGLRLFSPSSFSSLPGWMIPAWNDAELGYPPLGHVAEYLTAYEARYDLAVLRPHRVQVVARQPPGPGQNGRASHHPRGPACGVRADEPRVR